MKKSSFRNTLGMKSKRNSRLNRNSIELRAITSVKSVSLVFIENLLVMYSILVRMHKERMRLSNNDTNKESTWNHASTKINKTNRKTEVFIWQMVHIVICVHSMCVLLFFFFISGTTCDWTVNTYHSKYKKCVLSAVVLCV